MTETARAIDSDGHVEPAVAVDWTAFIPEPWGARYLNEARSLFSSDVMGKYRRGEWEPAPRLTDMDTEGIEAAVLFGGVVGLRPGAGVDVDYAAAYCRGYNDWLAAFCKHDPHRLKGVGLAPLGDMNRAVAELNRGVSEHKFVAGVVTPFFQDYNLDDPYFFPLFEEAQRLDVPITIHGQGEVKQSPLVRRHYTHSRRHALSFTFGALMACQDVLCGGVLERFPTLRLAILEAGATWLPYWLDRLDHHVEKLPHQSPNISCLPSEYMKSGRLFISCEGEETALPEVIDKVGDHCIIYASAYCH